LFAGLRERAGWGERDLALPPDLAPATPLAIWELLRLGAWPAGLRVAVNQDFAELHQPLEAGDELAFLPPISGG
jgi:molybdopterin synthase sulfur carrier subunit